MATPKEKLLFKRNERVDRTKNANISSGNYFKHTPWQPQTEPKRSCILSPCQDVQWFQIQFILW